jgi:hypothetical protein
MKRHIQHSPLRLQRLENRTAPAAGVVSVFAFADANLNGQYDSFGHAGEAIVRGVHVYADVNNNGQLDSGEPSGQTSTQFTFETAGTYIIRCEPLPGATFTTPNAIAVTVQGGNFESAAFGFDVTLNSSGAQELFAVGADAGGGPHVRVFNPDGSLRFDFMAYETSFRGGVRVATADVNVDGVDDIVTAPGPGGGPHVKVFDGRTGGLIQEWMAYDPSFFGGVSIAAWRGRNVATGFVFTGAGPGGGPHIRGWNPMSGEANREFFAFDPAFRGGVNVALADLHGDSSFPEVIAGAGPGGGPHVRVFDGQTFQETDTFFAYEPEFRGGVFVSVIDINQDGRLDIVTGAGAGGGPLVKVYDWHTQQIIRSFFAYDPAFRGGVRVGVTETPHQLYQSLAVAPGPGGGPHVRVLGLPGLQDAESFYAFDPAFTGGVFVG